MKKFSIVVPCYNVERYLSVCIESLCKQTLTDIEIILVDDGSSDNSGKICDEWAERDSRIKVMHKPNGGVSAARNDGMTIANGEYIIFCDSDDWLPENALEALYNEGISTNADVIIGDVYQSLDDKDTLARFYAKPFVTSERTFINEMIQADFYKTYCPMPAETGPAFGYGGPWNKAVKLNMLRDNGIKFDVRVKGIFDDIIYTAHILANAKTVAYITTPVYYYRLIPMSITRSFKANAPEINNAIFKSWEEFIAKFDRYGMFSKPYYAVVIRRFAEILPVYFFSEKNSKSLKEKLAEMKTMLHTEPYKTAIKEVDTDKLSAYQRQVHKMMSLESPFLIWVLFNTKLFIKKMLGRKI